MFSKASPSVQFIQRRIRNHEKVHPDLFVVSIVAVFTMAASAATGQSNYGSEVAIPFSFNVANKTYDAGTYIVKLSKLPNGVATFSIENIKTGDRQMVLLSSNGDREETR